MPGCSTILKFKKLTKLAHAPVRSSDRAAGLDLKSAYDMVLKAREHTLCKTDLQISVPSGCYGRIAPRSGLALKHGIDVGAGVIDEDYRGNIGIVLFNHSDCDFVIRAGDRIAQLVCEKIYYPAVEEVEELDITIRNGGGFGSTGV